jgi:vancomycin permeability regulator SanA
MKAYLVAHGMPDAAVVEDHAGFSTYDSCYRAKAVFGVHDAIVVSQSYHLPRAVFTCRRLGIDAVGLGRSEFDSFPEKSLKYDAREIPSSIKAGLELLQHPNPHFLGRHETGLDAAVALGRP